MIPSFIIDSIRRKEERGRSIQEQPFLELPITYRETEKEKPEDKRGVVILDLWG